MSRIEVVEVSAGRIGSAGSDDPGHPLNDLLGPLSLAEFLDRHFERSVLHVKGRARNRFIRYLSKRDVESLLWQLEPHLDDYADVVESATTSPRNAGAVPTGRCEWMGQRYREGGTIRLRDVGRIHRPIAVLQRSLEERLGGSFSANAFLTPPGRRGWNDHFDPNDVFVLQLEGSKIWRLARAPVELPVPEQWHALDDTSALDFREITLQAGDTLYLPRGVVHSPATANEPSLHLTIGHASSRWVDVLVKAVQMVAEGDVSLRRSFPLDGRGAQEVVEKLVQALTATDGGSAMIEDAASRLESRRVSQLRPLLSEPLLGDGRDRGEISAGDLVMRRPGQICHVASVGDRASITFPGLAASRSKAVDGPLAIEPALRFVADRDGPFLVSDLPDALTEASKVVLVKRLMAEGLITRVDGAMDEVQP